MLDKVLVELANKSGTITGFDGKYYITGETLFNAGICACPDCGKFMPIEFKYCQDCKRHIAIVVKRIAKKK